ncbi:ubiquitin carboxyl-terminal hydrolase 22 [Halyomorpha halys]|uniref:ubiquitin carboxyl-terminal hydrolase 22 n=1 Tax=Halyomorpha halys TaxID=286706 RepID=UPI0006D4E5B7
MICPHLIMFKTEYGLENYDTIYCSFILPLVLPDPTYYQACICCFDCETYNNDKLMACMHCIYFGCFEQHYLLHASSKIHNIFVEIPSGNIFCSVCKDFIYDTEVDDIVKKYSNFTGRQCVSWKPTTDECKLLREHSKRVKVDPSTSIGMKGIINLGNTCFMNCIVQAFLHTPMLRDYFFSDKHKCVAKKSTECLFCLLSRIYQRYYADDDSTTLSLHEILCLVWKHDLNLYGNNQKDAHEFFISARNLLHQVSSPHNHSQGPCNCIIDSIFHGNLQSDVVCQKCLNVSTKIDPLWEISLDIPEPPSEGGLLECLYHFTRPEPLGSNGKINCSTCKSYQEGTKQLTFKLLPLIIVIQLKRFEHVKSKYQKKCLYVPFPIDLDMSPFLTGRRNMQGKENQCNLSNPEQSNDLSDNRYSLYAVIVHKGTLSGGHYIAYIRRTKNKWFYCNDLVVVPVEIEDVLASEGYLFFYHKTVLPYE